MNMNLHTSIQMQDSQIAHDSNIYTKESSIIHSGKKKLPESTLARDYQGPSEAYQQQTGVISEKSTPNSRSKLPQPENIQLEPNPTAGNLQQQKEAKYAVSPEEFNTEVKEPKEYFHPELIVELPLYEPKPIKQAMMNDKDIFKSAEFWLNQGHQKCQKKALNVGPDRHSVALDYYLSGVKIDPEHYGCIYNTGCCYFYTGKYQNARKWFTLCI